jgi:release factor glutamine methyltransferase
MDLASALRDATRRLAQAGVASPQVDSEILLAHVAGVSRGEILAWVHSGRSMEEADLAQWDQLIVRRENREPLQHLTGTAAFMSFEVIVGPGVFVPRPETQSLVEHATSQAQAMAVRETGLHIVDLCSGSGVVAISLARAVLHASVVAVEASASAVEYLRLNADTLAPNITIVESDVVGFGHSVTDASIDMIVANPPYVPSAEIPNDPEVARYDPAMALYGGEDGLDTVREIVTLATRALRPGGYLAIEHSNLQGDAMRLVLKAAGFRMVSTELDFVGRERFTQGFQS